MDLDLLFLGIIRVGLVEHRSIMADRRLRIERLWGLLIELLRGEVRHVRCIGSGRIRRN